MSFHNNNNYKKLNNSGIEGKYINIIKDVNDTNTVHIIFNTGILKPFPLRSETRQECAFWSLFYNKAKQ